MKNNFSEKAEIELLEIGDLPIFSKVNKGDIPTRVYEMEKLISEADGVIISTPEYDHSPSAALLNALAWLSYTIHPFLDKPVMITGASYGTLGSSRSQAQLRQILDSPELAARIMPSSEYLLSHSLQAFDENCNLLREKDAKTLEAIFDDFIIFVDIVNKLVNEKNVSANNLKDFQWENQ